MPDRFTPEYWRSRAGEVRTLAEQMRDKFSHEALLRMARDYKVLALP